MEREFPSLPELRQTIHDLIIQSHCSGLSPPEEEMLEKMEAQEASGTRSNDCSGFVSRYFKRRKNHVKWSVDL